MSLSKLLAQIPGALLSGPCSPPGSPHSLPEAHARFLAESNGALAYHGYFRLFGLGQAAAPSLGTWNETSYWKFAWPNAPLESFVCFGGNAWGDQYAYKRGEGETIHLLGAFDMEPEPIADSFEGFFRDEFLRCAREPYDQETLAAFERCGPLGWGEHLLQAPPLLLAGELPKRASKMPARTAMVANGDVATQLADAPEQAVLQGLRPYLDDAGRDRLKVIWSD